MFSENAYICVLENEMKKLSCILFACFYLILTSGFALSVNYCMGSVSSVDIDSPANNVCHTCGMKGDTKSCCTSVFKFFKVNTSHLASSYAAGTHPVQLQAVVSGPSDFQSACLYPVHVIFPPFPPPLHTATPVYLLNNVFLI